MKELVGTESKNTPINIEMENHTCIKYKSVDVSVPVSVVCKLLTMTSRIGAPRNTKG